MVVPLPVVAHGAALGGAFGVGERDLHRAAAARRGGKEQLHGVDGLAHVPAAALRDVPLHAVLQMRLHALALAEDAHRARDGGEHLLRRHGFELENRAAAQKRVVNVKVRVFRRRGDEGYPPVLDELEQALLLLFVEVLYLVEIEQHAAGGEHGVQLGDDGLYVVQRGVGGVQPAEGALRALRYYVRNGGLAGAGGAVEHHVRHLAGFYHPAEQPARAKYVLLAHHLVEGGGAYLVCQRPVHAFMRLRR